MLFQWNTSIIVWYNIYTSLKIKNVVKVKYYLCRWTLHLFLLYLTVLVQEPPFQLCLVYFVFLMLGIMLLEFQSHEFSVFSIRVFVSYQNHLFLFFAVPEMIYEQVLLLFNWRYICLRCICLLDFLSHITFALSSSSLGPVWHLLELWVACTESLRINEILRRSQISEVWEMNGSRERS